MTVTWYGNASRGDSGGMAPYSVMNSIRRQHGFPLLSANVADIVATVLQQDQRVLLYGAAGTGKSTLATSMAQHLAQENRRCSCISADPGSPLMGMPGTLSLGQWVQDAWHIEEYSPLCTLDAGRFRLPLVAALGHLLDHARDGVILVDGPGVVRGVAGRELLEGLVSVVKADVVLVVSITDKIPPLLAELNALASAIAAEIYIVPAAAAAMRPGKRVRARRRTEQWDQYLGDRIRQDVDLEKVSIIGTPPPREQAHAWTGRQVALLHSQHTRVMGEVLQLKGNCLTLILPARVSDTDALLIRDAVRTADGYVETAMPWAAAQLGYIPPADVLPSAAGSSGPRLVGRVGNVDVAMINGVFGDPLLHIRLRHQRRSLLFDLGSGERLSARIAHQVSDVFISHAHLDHISGFVWLLRSRIGEFPACRLYGPPGLARHIAGFIQGVLWDRVTVPGPEFEVHEYDGNILRSFLLQATRPEPELLHEQSVTDGILRQESGFTIRAVLLDHCGTEVVAYAFEPDQQINVRKDRLLARGLQPGAWLNELKQYVASANDSTRIRLPDGSDASVAELASELLLISAGKKLVYATDLADTQNNRQRLVDLARNAHTFFCEAAFAEAEADNALRNGHLTTRACGEIAVLAGVGRLVPFHFSRRYTEDPLQIYHELKTVCPCVMIPMSAQLFETSRVIPDDAEIV